MKVHDSLPVLSDYLDARWKKLLPTSIEILNKLEEDIDFSTSVPEKHSIFKAFECDPESVSVVIFGQDPYPSAQNAMGLAFSVRDSVQKIPGSLRNIFSEIENDVGGAAPVNGDLTYLQDQGVMLLNRGLTLDLKTNRVNPLWFEFTNEVAKVLGAAGVVGIFWGHQAQELSKYFPEDKRIMSVHPSPLSAYRGFFGSKPFSSANKILKSENKKTIEWTKN
jgi:uracil-DNA glycosylase